MIYGSACSGIEAASVGWSELGWECAFHSEIDPFCCSLLAKRYPGVPNLGDLSTIRDAPHIDILVGGTPCQSFSIQGLRKGTAADSGVLAFHFLRLARITNPEFVVWENVPGVLSTDGGRPFGTFLGGLEELGYGWSYRVLDARFFGGPHNRRRVFVVGCSGGRSEVAFRALFEPEYPAKDPRKTREIRETDSRRNGTSRRPQQSVYGVTGDETPKFLREASPTFRASQGGEGNMVWWDVSQWERRRHLTVTEHERIMGFPDGYTEVQFKGKFASDRVRKNAIGNSMDTRVMKWIGNRISLSK